MERQTLAQRIKQLRVFSGFSQEELSERTELSLRTIQRIENGETQPRGYSLQRLAEVLGTTPADLLIAAAQSDGVPVEAAPGAPIAARTNHGTAAKTDQVASPTADNSWLILLNLSGLAFLLGPGLGVLAPFILWLMKKDKIDGVRETGKRVINFQLTYALVVGLYWGFVVYQGLFHVEIFELPRGVGVYYLIIFGPRLVNIVYVVVNTMRVARNQRPRYVPSIPFFHPVA